MDRNSRILVIDDNYGVRRTYQRILSSPEASETFTSKTTLAQTDAPNSESTFPLSFQITLAENGEKGITYVERSLEQAEPFTVAFIDMMMPGIDGVETTKRIWNLDPNIKIVIVTAFSDDYKPRDIVRAIGREEIFYLHKPFDLEELQQLTRALTRQWHLEREQESLSVSLLEANIELLEHKKKLEEDLFAAAQIQKSLVVREVPDMQYFDCAWQFLPCDLIGGDLVNVHQLDESHLAMYVLDISGHGVPAAMVTVSVSQMLLPKRGGILKKKINEPPHYDLLSPGKVLKRLDQEYPLKRFDMFFTIVYLILNINTGQICYSRAGHPPPVLVRSDGEIDLLREGGTIIGLGGILPFKEGETQMKPGDRLFLYTDGITECENDAEELFGTRRFYDLLLKYREDSLDRTCQRVIETVEIYRGDTRQKDDIALFAIECQLPYNT